MISQLEAVKKRPGADPRRELSALLGGRQLYIASNRGPFQFRLRNGEPEPVPAAGGLVTALSGLASYAPLTWVATASGPADRQVASRRNATQAAPGVPRISFVTPSDEALNWYYHRFSNPVLWFLQHGLWDMLRRPNLAEMIERGWNLGYKPVNEAFADALVREVGGQREPVIMVHDYHLYLVPGMLRRRMPGALLHHFTHIPWPLPGMWQPLPPEMRREICTGLLGADVIGFQTRVDASNFLRCCERFVPGARVDLARSAVGFGGRDIHVREYPISVDVGALRSVAESAETQRARENLTPSVGEKTIVRVDRLDPSKNTAMGFRAYGRLLERRPDLVGKVRFLAFLVPSRQAIAEYQRYAQEVLREVEAVNARFGTDGWRPVELFYEDNRAQSMAGLMLADVLMVNPVADGMNLVAKEGVIINERDAALVLSESAGAHAQLGRAAVSLRPRDLESTVSALEAALDMSPAERKHRARTLRWLVEAEDLSWWVRRQLEDLL